jgi:exosortase
MTATRQELRVLAICLAIVLGWWLYDLQVHWRTAVEYQHGWLVPFLAGYLAWERWSSRPPWTPPRSMLGSLALALAGLPLVLVAELYKHAVAVTPASSFALSLGCLCFSLAFLWQAGGRSWAIHFLFPLAFLFVAVPLPKILWNPVVLGLQAWITAWNVEALNLLGIPAVRIGNLIQLPNGTVGVDEACSGIRSLQSSLMAALFIGDLTFRRVGLKVLFLVAGVILAVAGNFGRSLYLSLTAARQGVESVATVHDTAGWSVLVFTAAGIGALAWFVLRLERRMAGSCLPEPKAGSQR